MARLLPANSVPNARFLGNTECDRDTGLACNWTNLEGKSVYRSCSTRACSLTTACRGSPNLRPNPDTVMTADQLVDIHPEVQNELTSRRSHLGATAFDRTTTPLESFVVPSSLGSGVGGTWEKSSGRDFGYPCRRATRGRMEPKKANNTELVGNILRVAFIRQPSPFYHAQAIERYDSWHARDGRVRTAYQ
jgi:hypothetical protein